MKILFAGMLFLLMSLCGCSGVKGLYDTEVRALDIEIGERYPEKVKAQELEGLPEPLKLYLSNTGIIGHDRIYRTHMVYQGFIKTSREGNWIHGECEQVNSPDLETRIWYGKFEMFPGVAFEGRHIWKRGNAHMLIKMGPITMVDLKGKEIGVSDMITWFNDLLFLPTALLQSNFTWTDLGNNSVNAVIRAGGFQASARLYFNDNHEITNFITDDRYMLDGTNIVKGQWQTPMRNYQVMNGLKLPSEGEALWHEETNDWVYFRILSEGFKVEYNQPVLVR